MLTTIVVSGAGSVAEWAAPTTMNATAKFLEDYMLVVIRSEIDGLCVIK
jgi:hypothetical protein